MSDHQNQSRESMPTKHARLIRGPAQMAFDITYRCNFRCRHCFNSSGHNAYMGQELTDAEVLEFMRDVVSMKPMNLCFCGGEPLLRERLLLECAGILAVHSIMVSMVTNGYLMTADRARQLRAGGVARVQVSLDGATAESYEFLRPHAGAFDRAVGAIRMLKDAGFEDISVAFCPTSVNWTELGRMFELCRKLGVNQLRVQPLMLLGRAKEFADIEPSPLAYRRLARAIMQLRTCGGTPDVQWGDPIDHLIRFRTLVSECVNHVCVKADGSIEVSPYLPVSVGNIKKYPLSEYWEAGLVSIWKSERIQQIAARIRSIADMNTQQPDTPDVWNERDLQLDLIDDKLLR